ncbi:MAG: TOBE domain-containing protein [Nitrososphaerales archaeon]|jgi:molybdate transport system regulatory protein
MVARKEAKPAFRLSLEDDAQVVLDQTDALLLRRISETASLKEGAKLSGISYRNAWDRIRAMESNLGIRLVETKVGGAGGGCAELTPEGAAVLRDFRKVRKYLLNVLDEPEYMAHASYKLSVRNRLRVRITKVEKSGVTALVKMTVQGPASLTSIISSEAAEDLDLREGDDAVALIKSTEVILAKQDPPRKRSGPTGPDHPT